MTSVNTFKEEKSLRLAFGCEARVGKDTACDYLERQLKGDCIRLSFAKALYDILFFAQRTCGFPEKKDRIFLQWVGTEWARNQNPNVWIDIVKNKINSTPSSTPIIVTDVRFPNEAAALKELGFTMVRIKRDMMYREEITQHSSETALSGYHWDFVIENNGTLDEFYHQIDLILTKSF